MAEQTWSILLHLENTEDDTIIEFRPSEESSIIDISVRGKQEARLTGSFVEWVLRNVPEKIVEITVYTPY